MGALWQRKPQIITKSATMAWAALTLWQETWLTEQFYKCYSAMNEPLCPTWSILPRW